jgi:hypothetical protein
MENPRDAGGNPGPSGGARRWALRLALLLAPLGAAMLWHDLSRRSATADGAAAAPRNATDHTGPVARREQGTASGAGTRAAPPGPPRPQIVAGEPQNHPEAFEDDLVELEQRSVFYQSAFEREGRDAPWASAMEQTVRHAYPTNEGVDARLLGVECRGTLCRLEFSYTLMAARVPHLGTIAQQFPELPSAAYTYPDERKVHDRAVIFLARQGAALPRFDPSAIAAEETL